MQARNHGSIVSDFQKQLRRAHEDVTSQRELQADFDDLTREFKLV